MKNELIKIDCKTCDKKKSMEATKLHKMSPVVVVIGYLLTIPSLLGIFFSLMLLLMSTTQPSTAVFGVGLAIFIGIFSLIGGLLGYLLIMKKNVYKCSNCSFIIDRA